ncbi:hypothetical protein [Streptococcus sanguinis]|uniref:hypothetical protein n=1 Tax=Streptococcus sanguinis TaxID=1305 RepID=UPI0039C32FF8
MKKSKIKQFFELRKQFKDDDWEVLCQISKESKEMRQQLAIKKINYDDRFWNATEDLAVNYFKKPTAKLAVDYFKKATSKS